MKESRELLPDSYQISSEEGTYGFYAKLAAINEQNGHFSAAEEFWLDAKRLAEREIDRHWADIRASICRQCMTKWRLTV